MSSSGVRAGGCSSLASTTHGGVPIGTHSFCPCAQMWPGCALVRSHSGPPVAEAHGSLAYARGLSSVSLTARHSPILRII